MKVKEQACLSRLAMSAYIIWYWDLRIAPAAAVLMIVSPPAAPIFCEQFKGTIMVFTPGWRTISLGDSGLFSALRECHRDQLLFGCSRKKPATAELSRYSSEIINTVYHQIQPAFVTLWAHTAHAATADDAIRHRRPKRFSLIVWIQFTLAGLPGGDDIARVFGSFHEAL